MCSHQCFNVFWWTFLRHISFVVYVFVYSLSTAIIINLLSQPSAIGSYVRCRRYTFWCGWSSRSSTTRLLQKTELGSCEYVISSFRSRLITLRSHTLMNQLFGSDRELGCVLWMNCFVLLCFFFRGDIQLHVIEHDQGHSVTALTFPSLKYHSCVLVHVGQKVTNNWMNPQKSLKEAEKHINETQ